MRSRYFQILPWLFICNCIAAVSAQRSRLNQTCTDRVTGAIGTCSLRFDCPKLFENLSPGQRPTVCGLYLPGVAIFCCTDTDKTNKQDCQLPNKPLIPGVSIASQKCAQYSAEYYSTVKFSQGNKVSTTVYEECQSKETHLIIGGQDAERNEFPFMAAVGWSGSDPEYKCGGSLISEKFVLTAAHCTYVPSIDRNPDKVKLGAHNIQKHNEENSLVIGIKRIITHEGFAFPRHYNDIALLELANPLKCFNAYIKPVCLWTSRENDYQSKAIAIGWGTSDTETRTAKDILQKASLNFYDLNAVCKKVYRPQKPRLALGLTDDMICAGMLDGSADTCNGDSGGPLITKNVDPRTCEYYLVGITSFGKHCALRNSSGIYMKVQSYIDWIERNAWPELKAEQQSSIFT